MEEKHGEILIYQTENGLTDIEVKMQDETVWLTQQQLVELYQMSANILSIFLKRENLMKKQLFGNSEQLLRMEKNIILLITIWT